MRLAKMSLLLSFLYVGLAVAQPAPTTPAAPAAVKFSLAVGKSEVSYDVVHPLHKVHGVSKKVDGKALLLPDGRAQVMVRVAADSFESGNVNRDSHVKEVIEAGRFPMVEIKATADGITVPPSLPGTVEKTFKAEISFHGVKKSVDLPVKLTFEADGSVRAQATVTLSIEGFSVERPALMFKKVNDEMSIEANVVFTKG